MIKDEIMINQSKTNKAGSFFKFIIPSIIGVFLFMIPIPYGDGITIPIAIFSKFLQGLLNSHLSLITTGIIFLISCASVVNKAIDLKLDNESYFKKLIDVSPIWVITRVLGCVFAVITYLQIGPEFIYSANTGGLLLNELLTVLFSVFLFAGFFLPLLLDFGLLEFFGVIFSRIMRPIFMLPGRSSIDCIASWLGDGTIGILLTSKQFEEGYYTEKEAAVIGTAFSAVSITFSLVVLAQVNLQNYFAPYYLTIIFTGIVAAIITPRIPPLSNKMNRYIDGRELKKVNSEEYISFNEGLKLAVNKAKSNWDLKKFVVSGMQNVFDMWFGVVPVVMAMGTIALIIAEYTPVFSYLGIPMIPILNLLHIPEASTAAQTFVIGFADMFLPSVLAAGISSPITRFVIAGVSVTQLIYMSEVGGLLLGSKIPVSFRDLIIIFIERTLISLPIFSFVAHLLF